MEGLAIGGHFLAGGTPGQTPLDADEAAQLLSSAITTREELDRAEQDNIAKAVVWALGDSRSPSDVLDERFVRRLHRRMFDEVWRWAGTYRDTARNLGADAWTIPERVATVLGDARYWIDNATYPLPEVCVRLHHRLVAIHPFPNGNGRHARLMADVLAVSLSLEPPGWGRGLLLDQAELRARYIAALQAADAGDITDLLELALA